MQVVLRRKGNRGKYRMESVFSSLTCVQYISYHISILAPSACLSLFCSEHVLQAIIMRIDQSMMTAVVYMHDRWQTREREKRKEIRAVKAPAGHTDLVEEIRMRYKTSCLDTYKHKLIQSLESMGY